MIEKLETFPDNVLAIAVVDGFTEADEALCEKWFQEKLDQGASQVNVLMKLDELKLSATSAKAFFEDALWALRHYKQLGHLAIVAHSKMMKALVPIDNLFFERDSKGRHERYFDVGRLQEAIAFVQEGPK